jgi:hypothetical protein
VIWRSRFPLVERLAAGARPLPQLLLASVGMFVLAHVVLFRLHYPDRYTKVSFQILLSFATAVVLVVVMDALFRWASRGAGGPAHWRQALVIGSTAAVGLAFTAVPALIILRASPTLYNNFYGGGAPALYEFFQRQPKDAVIASIATEVDYFPTFAQRPILVGPEYAIPLHVGYYRQIRERAGALFRAQYATDVSDVKAFIRKYQVRFWVIEHTSFTREYLIRASWVRLFEKARDAAVARVDRGETLALPKVAPRCTAFTNERYVVLDARCIVRRF